MGLYHVTIREDRLYETDCEADSEHQAVAQAYAAVGNLLLEQHGYPIKTSFQTHAIAIRDQAPT